MPLWLETQSPDGALCTWVLIPVLVWRLRGPQRGHLPLVVWNLLSTVAGFPTLFSGGSTGDREQGTPVGTELMGLSPQEVSTECWLLTSVVCLDFFILCALCALDILPPSLFCSHTPSRFLSTHIRSVSRPSREVYSGIIISLLQLRRCRSGRLGPAEGLARAKQNKQELRPFNMTSGSTQGHSGTEEVRLSSSHTASSGISIKTMLKLEPQKLRGPRM